MSKLKILTVMTVIAAVLIAFSGTATCGKPEAYDGISDYTINKSEVQECLEKYECEYPTPPGEHPRLFVREAGLESFKKKVQHPKLKKYYDEVMKDSEYDLAAVLSIFKEGSHTNNQVRECIQACAFRYLLNKEAAFGQKAVDAALKYLKHIEIKADDSNEAADHMFMAALVYDWCYDLLEPDEKERFIWYIEKLARVCEIQYPPVGKSSIASHSVESQMLMGMFSAGIAIYDEQPRMYDMAASRLYKEFIPGMNYYYKDNGMLLFSTNYNALRGINQTWAELIQKGMGLPPLFTNMENSVWWEIYQRRPDGQKLRYGDVTHDERALGYWWIDSVPIKYILSAANLFQNPYFNYNAFFQLQYWEENFFKKNLGHSFDILLCADPYLEEKELTNLPLTRYFGGAAGRMTARTGWDMLDINSHDVIVDMNIGGRKHMDHGHLDAGSFQVYYKGALAIDSGMYRGTDGGFGSNHNWNYNKRTIAHNALLIKDPKEIFFYKGERANDGGQRIPMRDDNTWDGMYPLSLEGPNGFLDDRWKFAEVTVHSFGPDEVRPDYSYIKGDITSAYTAKVSEVKRSMVFLNFKESMHPAGFIVFDKVVSTNQAFKKTWLLHSIEEPVVEGTTSTIKRTENGYTGKLVNHTIIPSVENLDITVVGGSGMEFRVDGKNYTNERNEGYRTSEESGDWRIEVSPRTETETDYFLNIMQVMDGEVSELPCNRIDGTNVIGVSLNNYNVFFNKEGQITEDEVKFKIDESLEDQKYLITDLAAGKWEITRTAGGKTYTSIKEVTDEERIVYFTDVGGSFSMKMHREEDGTDKEIKTDEQTKGTQEIESTQEAGADADEEEENEEHVKNENIKNIFRSIWEGIKRFFEKIF